MEYPKHFSSSVKMKKQFISEVVSFVIRSNFYIIVASLF